MKNPPAFPTVVDQAPELHEGMSLRDFFAAHAMQGFLASLEYGGSAGRNPDKCAEWAYQQADAMLKARESVLAW